jgi:hypothetical protein
MARRRGVARVIGQLSSEELPGAADFRVRVFVLPDGEVNGWARRVSGWPLWVVFRFDGEVVEVVAATDRRPPPRPASS